MKRYALRSRKAVLSKVYMIVHCCYVYCCHRQVLSADKKIVLLVLLVLLSVYGPCRSMLLECN